MARSNNAITFGSAFNITAASPIDSRMAVDYVSDLYLADTWPSDKAPIYNGMTVTVKETGEIFVLIDKSNYTLESGWKKVGSGLGAKAVETYADAVSAATNDNIGQLIYVKNSSYAYTDGDGKTVYVSTLDEVPTSGYTYVDGEETKFVTDVNDVPEGTEYTEVKEENTPYGAGSYVVTGANTLQKLAQSSASGDVSGDIANIQTKIGEMNEDIDDLADAVSALTYDTVHTITGDDVEE